MAEEKHNVHVAGRSKEEFVAWRKERDFGLAASLLLLPSVQANIRAGKLLEAEANGVHYLKTPVTLQDQPLRR